MNEIIKDIFYPIVLTACLLCIPLTFSKDLNIPIKSLFICWSICILSMCIGVPGKATTLLLTPFFPSLSGLDLQKFFGLSILSSWGTSYPLYLIVKKNVEQLKNNSFSENLQFSFAYFFGLHLIFSVLGLIILIIAR